MQFSPFNKIVKLCIQGIALEEQGKPDEAGSVFLQAWNEASNDLEKFLAAYFMARHQTNAEDRLEWLQSALQFAQKINDDSVRGAIASLHMALAQCYEDLSDFNNAKRHQELAQSFTGKPTDKCPFYHGTKAHLQVGSLLLAGYESNYQPELIMNHVYFTALLHGAGLAAALAKGDGQERIYIVEPTGDFENDPNVTDKKFPGNLTRSYRAEAPLKIIGEVIDWVQHMPEELQQWRKELAKSRGAIIN